MKSIKREKTNYYVNKSVGILVSMPLTAIHEVGLGAIIHIIKLINYNKKILERPNNMRAYLNIPFGFPSSDCDVPNINR